MTWWQIVLTVWASVGVLIFAFYWWASGRDETSHGSDALLMIGCVGAVVWPLYVAWLPFAGLWWLAEKLFGREGTKP